MGRAFKRTSPRDPIVPAAVPVDTITEIDYPPEAEMMFTDQPGPPVPNDSSHEPLVDLHTLGGDGAVAAGCSVTSNEPVLILSSLSQYTELPETSLESPFADTDVLAPSSLELVTTRQLLCIKHLLRLRTPNDSSYVDTRSIPSTKQGASQYGYVPDGCDVWIGFYIFPHIIIGIMILPSCGFGVMMWRYIRRPASQSRTYTQSSPFRNPGVKRHDNSPHPNLARTAGHLLENPTRCLTGPELEATIVTSGYEEQAVAASTPRAFRISTRPAMRRLRSTWKTWSDTFTCMQNAQLLSISVQILSIFFLLNLWVS